MEPTNEETVVDLLEQLEKRVEASADRRELALFVLGAATGLAFRVGWTIEELETVGAVRTR